MTINISLFQTILNRKYVRPMLAYPDSAIGFIQSHFYWTYQFHTDSNSMRILYIIFLLTES